MLVSFDRVVRIECEYELIYEFFGEIVAELVVDRFAERLDDTYSRSDAHFGHAEYLNDAFHDVLLVSRCYTPASVQTHLRNALSDNGGVFV